MSRSSKILCAVYALTALFALIATWSHNFAYLHLGWREANPAFWRDAMANPAGASLTVDIFFLGFAVNLWMLLEARRIGLRGIWLYVLAGFFIAISVAVPAFMIQRERILAARGEASVTANLSTVDFALLAIFGIGVTLFALGSLHP